MRRRYRWDPETKSLVEIGADYGLEARALDAPVMVDRFMEGAVSQDGVDIGSRRKRREYMKVANVADYSDYEGVRQKKAAELERMDKGEWDSRQRREDIGRALWLHQERARGRTKF